MKKYKNNRKQYLTDPYAMQAILKPDRREPITRAALPAIDEVESEREWSEDLEL